MKNYYKYISTQPILLLVILLASLGQLTRLNLFGKAILSFEVVILVQIIAWTWKSFKEYFLAMIGIFQKYRYFFGWIFISYLLNIFRLYSFDSISGGLLIWFKIGLFICFGVGVQLFANSFDTKKALLAFSSLISWFGILQFIVLPDTRFLKILGWDDHYYRLISTILDPNYAGIIITGGILLLLLSQKWKWPQYTLLAGHILALGLTFSRSAWLALLVGVMVISFSKASRSFSRVQKIIPYILGTTLFLIAFLGLLFSNLVGNSIFRMNSINDRVLVSKRIFSSYQTNDWLWGRGLFTYFRDETSSYQQVSTFSLANTAHIPNSWVETILAGSGVIGLGIFGYYLWRWIEQNRRHTFSLATALAFLFFGLFNNILTSSFCLLWLALVLSIKRPSQK